MSATPATVWPNMIYDQPEGENINWTPAAQGPDLTTHVDPITTTDEIREFFDIQPPLVGETVPNEE